MADMNIEISEVKIRLGDQVQDPSFLGWASAVINGLIFVNNIAVIRDPDGKPALRFPTSLSSNGKRHFHFNPITTEAAAAFEHAILGKLNEFPGEVKNRG